MGNRVEATGWSEERGESVLGRFLPHAGIDAGLKLSSLAGGGQRGIFAY